MELDVKSRSRTNRSRTDNALPTSAEMKLITTTLNKVISSGDPIKIKNADEVMVHCADRIGGFANNKRSEIRSILMQREALAYSNIRTDLTADSVALKFRKKLLSDYRVLLNNFRLTTGPESDNIFYQAILGDPGLYLRNPNVLDPDQDPRVVADHPLLRMFTNPYNLFFVAPGNELTSRTHPRGTQPISLDALIYLAFDNDPYLHLDKRFRRATSVVKPSPNSIRLISIMNYFCETVYQMPLIQLQTYQLINPHDAFLAHVYLLVYALSIENAIQSNYIDPLIDSMMADGSLPMLKKLRSTGNRDISFRPTETNDNWYRAMYPEVSLRFLHPDTLAILPKSTFQTPLL